MSETVTLERPRPITLTHAMKIAAAEKMADQLIKGHLLEEIERADAVRSIANHGTLYGDGYRLMKNLEDYDGWEGDFRMAEEFEAFSLFAQDEMKAAEKAWFEETQPQPKLKKGDRIQLRRGETGVIDGIYEYGVAQYTVAIDGDPQALPPTNSRRIVRFEDAVLCLADGENA
ncbi:hypothetical protein [Pseudorhodoplanes sinuspersici]|uniref:Uncharacterized protein n=1 Tax=Pseudorhodoplanes sinuspersici TaxID=1235591 RepID=A0A1W6ZYU7_9HYPH|nr:hypothetical protein [Pseudorhodoplanes sinuspersici]ARQ01915.1 hypothetical protein CAK95_24555 [Pseudorhodoplanes sinuspersici]RKE73686.1 hypothetical protein DFP91_1581 [Pseudorhodoplanes sinuspersici]